MAREATNLWRLILGLVGSQTQVALRLHMVGAMGLDMMLSVALHTQLVSKLSVVDLKPFLYNATIKMLLGRVGTSRFADRTKISER